MLYPQWLRDVMLTLAAEGSFQPAWSRQIIDEMRRNVLRNHPEIDPDRFDTVTVGTLHRAFPDAWIEVPDDLIRLSVGIESIDDLLGDLAAAFDRL